MTRAGLVMLLGLGVSSVARAMPWWVDDDAEAATLEVLLAELWPEHPFEVRVGEPLDDTDGVHYADGELVLVRGDLVRRQALPPHPSRHITAVRSWTWQSGIEDPAWRPDLPLDLPELRKGRGPRVVLHPVGLSYRAGTPSPGVRVGAEVGARTGPVRLSAAAHGVIGEQISQRPDRVVVHSAVFGASASLATPQAGGFVAEPVVFLGVGPTIASVSSEVGTPRSVRLDVVGHVGLGARAWGSVGGALLGAGAALDVATGQPWYVTRQDLVIASQVSVVVGLVVLLPPGPP